MKKTVLLCVLLMLTSVFVSAAPAHSRKSAKHLSIMAHYSNPKNPPKYPDLTEIQPGKEFFQPHLRLSGIGADRKDMSQTELETRTNNIIASMTFGVMRCQDGKDLDAEVWAKRLTAPKLKELITSAANSNRFPKALLEGLIFIESGGKNDAVSPTGPKGIGQISTGTGLQLGLIGYKTVEATVASKKKGKSKKTTRRQIAFDYRGDPEKAIPAMAKFLAEMSANYKHLGNTSLENAQQFAIWAYHSGEGVPNKALVLAHKAGIKDPDMAKIFFMNSPGYNQELFNLVENDLSSEKDYGATYYFRVVRASQLLDLYRSQPQHQDYLALMKKYKSSLPDSTRAKSRFENWHSPKEMLATTEDLIKDKNLVRAPENPEYFSYTLRTTGPGAIGEKDPKNQTLYMQDPPEVIGALINVSSAVRKGWEQSHPRGEKFVPLEVTSMIRTLYYQGLLHEINRNSKTDFPTHTIGAVDVSFARLPIGEQTWLRFVIQDMGWDEYLGYFDEHHAELTMHFAPAPGAPTEFFLATYTQALENVDKHKR